MRKISLKKKEKKGQNTFLGYPFCQAASGGPNTSTAASSPSPEIDAVLTEAIKACVQKSGASVVAIENISSISAFTGAREKGLALK